MFVHPTADIQTSDIGEGTRVWQYCVILPGAKVGKDGNICAHCFIENDVRIGDRVTIKCGVQLWDGITIEDDVFIGPNVTFTNDPYPRSRHQPKAFSRTLVKRGASIGANSTLLPGITIGHDALIGAGSVITSNVPPGTIVAGNPARILRYVAGQVDANSGKPLPAQGASRIEGVRWIDLGSAEDIRGQLTFAQWNQHLPFIPQRMFFVHHVPTEQVRGEHAHKECQQILCCVAGFIHVVVDDGTIRDEYVLDTPHRGLLIPPRIWATQYRYSHNAVLAVFASHPYDPDDYIRDYDEFLRYRRALESSRGGP
jgi:acetyltransferase-like isoleucine patch superfamily enzyme/dTDP-4-dehydrorhamnose 3,5-epimerase-like enzyme